jgi:hypothetical protein
MRHAARRLRAWLIFDVRQMKTRNAAEVAFDRLLRPMLAKLQFEEVRLKDCMRPEFLFRKSRIWFSLSWDWRDQYLDVCLGRLFWFRDVMPRVVVIGDFSYWNPSVTWDSIRSESDFEVVFTRIQVSLPGAVARVEDEYARLLDDFRKSRGERISVDDYIGEEAAIGALEKYRA